MVFTLQAKVVQQDGKTTSIITHEFAEEYLPTILEGLTDFLRGCGYQLTGYLTEADDPADANPNQSLLTGGAQES